MNFYLVMGERSVDMCGATETDILGVTQKASSLDWFDEPRPSKLGTFKYGGEWYLRIYYEKIEDFHRDQLTYSLPKKKL